MTLRNIVKIDEAKCNGCGQCVSACAEGAIKLINGKAKLISETYCDGLGVCLGHCPQDAITVEQRDCAQFDEKAVEKHLESQKNVCPSLPAEKGFVCPGTSAKQFNKKDSASGDVSSQLSHWPIQLHLVSSNAPFFKNADLLVAADCVAFAMGEFHSKFLKGRSVVIACPKLDDTSPYLDKLAEIISNNNLKSLTVVHMEVPCCSGLTRLVQQAVAKTGKKMKFEDITIGLDGKVKKQKSLKLYKDNNNV
ncbi:MAG: ATP-binding protein [Sedimentisphaerales bacterium]